MRKLRFCLFGIPSALLLGCGGPPVYERPAVPLPAQWQGDATRQAAALAPDWNRFFTDPRLQALIGSALAHNRDIQLAAARVEEARALLRGVEAERLPAITLDGRYNAETFPPVSGGGRPTFTQRADIGLSMLTFEIDFWGRLASLSAASRARFLASDAAVRTVRMAIIAEVANAYFSVLEFDDRLGLAREILRTRETTRTVVEQAFTLGAAARPELLQIDSAIESTRNEIDGLERLRATTLNYLDSLTGYAAAKLPGGRTLANQSLEAAFVGGLPSEILLRRPDVIAAEQRLIEANANIGAARAAFFPRILLAAGVGLASTALSSLLSGGGTASALFTPSISLPLFDNGRNESTRDVAEARKHVAVADYEKTVQAAFREIADLLATQKAFRGQKRSAGAEFALAQERVQIAEARHLAGAGSYLELLDAIRAQLLAGQTLAQFRRAELSTAVQLYKALGGGDDVRAEAGFG